MFARVAPRYDLLNRVLSLGIDRRWRRRVVKQIPKEAKVLDLCCGTGDLSFALAEAGHNVTGADFCAEMLQVAEEKQTKKKSAVQFVQADATSLPFAESEFDCATIAFGLRNIPDTMTALAEIRRVLKPEGLLLVLDFSSRQPFYVAPFYKAYFHLLLPLIGKILAPKSGDAYRYLPESVKQFPSGKELTAKLEEAGFAKTAFQPLTFGIANLYSGRAQKKTATGND